MARPMLASQAPYVRIIIIKIRASRELKMIKNKVKVRIINSKNNRVIRR